MRTLKNILIFVFSFLVIVNTISCADQSKKETPQAKNKLSMTQKYNPVIYFEIPVKNMERAMQFYTAVFHFSFEREVIDQNDMALFPFVAENAGIAGALAKGEIYKPTKEGVLIYFKTENIDRTLQFATQNGGHILYPKTSNGELGFVAEFEDTEGNRIALHESVK